MPSMKRLRSVEAAVEDALRCTEHIPERDIRAMYIVRTLQLDGFVVQPVRRDTGGRFCSPAALGEDGDR